MNEPFTYEVSFTCEPDAATFNALFGDTRTGYEVTLNIPARRRTVWEWLTRKPPHHPRRIYIPNARLIEEGKS